MARHYGTIATAMWDDPEFRKLSTNAQRVYVLLITQSGITSVGTLPITLRRWSQYASDSSSDSLSNGLTELADSLFVVIDWDQEELLVRSFVRWDGGHTNPKRLAAIRSAAVTVASPLLSGVLAFELTRLGVEHAITTRPIDSHSMGYPENADSPRSVVTYVSSSTTHTPQQESTLREPHAKPPSKLGARGTRIPDDFAITDTMRSWATEKVPGMDIDFSTEKFINHFQSASGQRATMVDWVAAWRKWMLGDYKPISRASPPAAPSRHDENEEAVHRMQLREQAMRNGANQIGSR